MYGTYDTVVRMIFAVLPLGWQCHFSGSISVVLTFKCPLSAIPQLLPNVNLNSYISATKYGEKSRANKRKIQI